MVTTVRPRSAGTSSSDRQIRTMGVLLQMAGLLAISKKRLPHPQCACASAHEHGYRGGHRTLLLVEGHERAALVEQRNGADGSEVDLELPPHGHCPRLPVSYTHLTLPTI